ncbi:hypothetical protein [Hymenobacter latericus]|uniref:hypothetical protein n=1 Tax=Hymenobacter sp. YIM 151858-1 TaxID=2987688 RepID=UPI002225FD2F|nr:hypothetical protein [Hymenobacter sp. YIM 151858-1]UYZ60098.1 hypothetical protein OIS50_04680 [Hymenobacter sp. YIM 151858-1]
MPKRIHAIVRTVRALADEQGSNVSPSRLNALLPTVSQELFNHFLGRPEDGTRQPAYQINTRVSVALWPFLKEQAYSTSEAAIAAGLARRMDAQGNLTAPSDLCYPTAIRVPGAKVAVDLLDDAQLDHRLNCPITGPTPEYPCAEMRPGFGWKLYGGADSCTVKYLAYPPEPKYAFTVDADDNEVYDEANSVDTGWGRAHEPDLVARLLKYLGLSMREGMMQQAAQLLSQEND